MIKSYRLEEYQGEIETECEYVNEALRVDDSDAKRIMSDIFAQVYVSDNICVSEILSNLLEKYYGKELIFALFYLGYKIGWMHGIGIIEAGRKEEEQEGYL